MAMTDIEAEAEATVAALPAQWADMTPESSKLLTTFMLALEQRAGTAIAYRSMLHDAYNWPDDMPVVVAVKLKILPPDAAVGLAEADEVLDQCERAERIILDYMASAGCPEEDN
jgi:hypothetical protein